MRCIKIKPARFNKRVTLQTAARVSDGQGGWTEAWADSLTVWAKVEPLKGWEKMQAVQAQTPLTHRVTMRYTAAATTAKRLKYAGRVMDIKEVINPNEDDAFLQLACVETT